MPLTGREHVVVLNAGCSGFEVVVWIVQAFRIRHDVVHGLIYVDAQGLSSGERDALVCLGIGGLCYVTLSIHPRPFGMLKPTLRGRLAICRGGRLKSGVHRDHIPGVFRVQTWHDQMKIPGTPIAQCGPHNYGSVILAVGGTGDLTCVGHGGSGSQGVGIQCLPTDSHTIARAAGQGQVRRDPVRIAINAKSFRCRRCSNHARQ